MSLTKFLEKAETLAQNHGFSKRFEHTYETYRRWFGIRESVEYTLEDIGLLDTFKRQA